MQKSITCTCVVEITQDETGRKLRIVPELSNSDEETTDIQISKEVFEELETAFENANYGEDED